MLSSNFLQFNPRIVNGLDMMINLIEKSEPKLILLKKMKDLIREIDTVIDQEIKNEEYYK